MTSPAPPLAVISKNCPRKWESRVVAWKMFSRTRRRRHNHRFGAPNLRAANAQLSLAQAKKHKIVGGVFGMMVHKRDQKAHGEWYRSTDKKLGRNHI